MNPRTRVALMARGRDGLCSSIVIALLIANGLFAGVAAAQTHTLGEFPTDEAYIRYLGNTPGSFAADWTTDMNGVTHDDTHWYFGGKDSLHRVPLSERIDRDLAVAGVPHVSIRDLTALTGYGHLGDISWYRHAGTGYVLVPVDDGPDGAPPKLAIFRGDDSLALLHVLDIPGQMRGSKGSAAFAAVDGAGRVYSVGSGACSTCPGGGPCSCLRRYTLDWSRVGSAAVYGISLAFESEIPLRDAAGQPIQLTGWQGAVIAPSDRIVYVSNGYNCNTVNRGLHAFDLQTGRELARSGIRAYSLFRFQFDCELFDPAISTIDGKPGNQEPEGLTIWDLDDVPNRHGIRGQLHVLLLDNDLVGNDHAFFKHYTGKLFVDPTGSSTGTGRIDDPYASLDEALLERSCPRLAIAPAPPCVERPAAWSGSTLVLAPGSYPDDLTDPRLERHAITVRGSGGAEFGR
jgi:hypothetical protein